MNEDQLMYRLAIPAMIKGKGDLYQCPHTDKIQKEVYHGEGDEGVMCRNWEHSQVDSLPTEASKAHNMVKVKTGKATVVESELIINPEQLGRDLWNTAVNAVRNTGGKSNNSALNAYGTRRMRAHPSALKNVTGFRVHIEPIYGEPE